MSYETFFQIERHGFELEELLRAGARILSKLIAAAVKICCRRILANSI